MSVLMTFTIIPSFVFAAELPFTDVAADAWYYGDVKGAYDTGLINGMTATSFEPESNMTYAQAVKLAACMNQKYSTGSVTLANGSPDWWDSYVAYAKEKNIINKDYDWNSNATRAGYVEIFAKALPDEALNAKNSIANGYIPDVTMVHPQAAAIYKLYRAGILTGTDEIGTFEPDNNIRRSEVSAILTRMMNESARKELTLGPVTKKVVFNSNGGSSVQTQQVNENEKAARPADPAREGYEFAGWYKDSGLTEVFDFAEVVTGDLLLYAKWKEVETSVHEYTVSFDSCGGSAVAEQKIKENKKAAKPEDPSRGGYVFLGWYKDSGLTSAYNFTAAVTGDLTLYAKWKERIPGEINDTWELIIASVNNGTYKNKYMIGDTKSLNLGSEGVVVMQIAAFDADELADESGKMAAITWISKQMLKSDHRMNPGIKRDPADNSKYKTGTGSIGGWEHSEMRSWLQSDIKSLIPDSIRSAIKPVKKYTRSFDVTGNAVNDALSIDDLWIPSCKEVFGSKGHDKTGPVYSNMFASDRDLFRQKPGSRSTRGWWLRSADDISCFDNIYTNGNLNFIDIPAYYDELGVVLGFCL